MDTDRIKEIKKISLNEKVDVQLKLPSTYWLNAKQSKLNKIFVKINNDFVFFPFDNNTRYVCNINDLDALFKLLKLNSDNLICLEYI